MNILIIQTAFIGNVILTTPVVEVLKKNLPDADIDFLTIPESFNLVETNPHLRQIIIFDKRGKNRGIAGLKQAGSRLCENHYDICITPHRSWRSASLSKRTKAPIRIGFNISAKAGAFTHLQTYRSDIHEIERNLSLLNQLNINPSISRPAIFPTKEDHDAVDNKINKRADSLFAIAPGSIWPTKRWPAEYFAEMCGRLVKRGYVPVLVGSKNDRELCDQIAASADSVITTAGEFSLRQTYSLLSKCKNGLLTNDSAPLHLAVAAGIPVYAIFGATVPAFGFAPLGEESEIIENKILKCRPCGIHGGYKCPMRTFDCMKSIYPELVEKVLFDENSKIMDS